MVLGALDTGKTTFTRRLLRAAAAERVRAAWVDTDLGQSSVGPPTTIGLRVVDAPEAVDHPPRPDQLYFVGDVTPSKHPVTVVAGVARAVTVAKAHADLVVVDTSSYLTGLTAERIKFHKLELAAPAHVVGLQRGGELEPLLTIARRFTDADVSVVPVQPGVRSRSVERRAEHRRARMAEAFAGELRRFRVPPEALAPSVPPGLDLALLEGVLVGLDDGGGGCFGLGRLGHDEAGLHLLAAADQSPRGLRLGGLRLDADWRPREYDLRELFASV